MAGEVGLSGSFQRRVNLSINLGLAKLANQQAKYAIRTVPTLNRGERLFRAQLVHDLLGQPSEIREPSATGNPILPFHIEAAAFWTTKSWDRHQVPKPGSTVAVAMGPPIYVPAGADEAAIEAGRVALETALARLRDETVGMLR